MVSAVRRRRSQHGNVVRRSHERPTGVTRAITRAVALLLLLPVAAAHGIHAHAQGRLGNAGQSRADFLGTTLYSAAGCSNGLTCGPSYCVRASNSEAVNNKANMTGAYRTCGCSAGARTPYRTCGCSAGARSPPGCAGAGRNGRHIALLTRLAAPQTLLFRSSCCSSRLKRAPSAPTHAAPRWASRRCSANTLP